MQSMMPTNVVQDWFTDLANSLSDSLANTRVDIVKELAKTSLPTVDQLHSQWYMLGLGGTYGLATKLVLLVVVLLGLIMILTPLSNHSVRMRRSVQSLLFVGIFGALFFPLYSLAYNLVQAGSQGMINIALGKESSSLNEAAAAMTAVLMPTDVWFKVIVCFIGLLLTYGAFIIAWANFLGVLITGMVYPVANAVRPLGEKFNSLFHAANSAVVTTLLTPLIVTFGLLLPTFAAKMIPVVGSTGISAGIFTIIGGLISFIGPILVAFWAFKGSSEVFGQLDSGSIGGSVDVDSMPPTSSRDMDNSVKESGFKAFATSMIAGGATAQLGQSDNLLGDIKSLAVEGAAVAATASGYPLVGAALNAVDTTTSKEKRAHAAQGQQAMPPPTGPPVNMGGPAPSPPPASSSPIQEWPDKK